MRRLLLSVLLLGLIAVAAVTPYLFGVEAERIFEQQMTLLDSSNKISIVDRRFRRGWFSSTAETTVALRNGEFHVFSEHAIEHGPFPISNPLKYLVSLRPLQALITSTLARPGTAASNKDVSVGTLTTMVNIDGSTDTDIDIQASSTQLEDAATLAWGDVSGTVEFEPSRASWEGLVKMEEIDWVQHDSSISLGRSELTFLTFPGSTGLAMGESSLKLDALKARLPGSDHQFESGNLRVDSTAEEQGRNVKYSFNGGFSSALLPKLELSSARWHLSAHDLDLDSLTELNNLGAGAAVPLNKLLALVSRRSASLDSALSFQTDSGPLDASARIRLSGDGGTTNPLAIIGALDGEVELEFPPAVAKLAARAAVERELSDLGAGDGQPVQNPDDEEFMDSMVSARIQSWLDGNLLTRDGDRYRFQASVRKGSLNVNGEPLNILSLLR